MKHLLVSSLYINKERDTDIFENQTHLSHLQLPKIRTKISVKDEEMVKVKLFYVECKFQDLLLLENFNAQMDFFTPCTGYVGLLKEDSLFISTLIDRNIFRGISIYRFPEKQCFIDYNQLIEINKDLLGNFSWIGVYRKEEEYFVVCVSNLPSHIWEELKLKIDDEWNHKITCKQFIELSKPYREEANLCREKCIASLLGNENERINLFKSYFIDDFCLKGESNQYILRFSGASVNENFPLIVPSNPLQNIHVIDKNNLNKKDLLSNYYCFPCQFTNRDIHENYLNHGIKVNTISRLVQGICSIPDHVFKYHQTFQPLTLFVSDKDENDLKLNQQLNDRERFSFLQNIIRFDY